MPDIPNRSDEEAALAYLLISLFQQQQADALSLLGDPPDARRIPPSFYDDMRRDLALATAAYLVRIHAEAAGRLADFLGFDADAEQALATAEEWATQRAGQLSDELVARIQTAVESAVLAAQSEEPDNQLATLTLAAATIWSIERAEAIAVTEVTGANSAGELDERDALEDQYGVKIVVTWHAESDACPVCADLDGEEEEVWMPEYPSGPPAHPNCRCGIVLETA